jgi:hypothetical protein
MKRRTSPIWAAVEMNSNAVGLTDVVRASRTAVSAYEFTSQFYFEESQTDAVFGREPYSAHTGQR